MSQQEHISTVRHYYVDEAGDPTIFDHKGRVVIGKEGCSQYFVLGFVDIRNPEALAARLQELRLNLLAEPYFKGVPSMQPEARKTAMAFHAKDDLQEVRREVLGLLRRTDDIRFFAVVRDKRKVLEYVQRRNQYDLTYRYNPNELYDYIVRRLFKTKLHREDHYHICFARRGESDRMAALRAALEGAKTNFSRQWGIVSTASVHITASRPQDTVCLQVVDYFLWALQRFYEKGEGRFIEMLWPACRVIIDEDDKRHSKAGEYYTQAKPLTLAALEGRL